MHNLKNTPSVILTLFTIIGLSLVGCGETSKAPTSYIPPTIGSVIPSATPTPIPSMVASPPILSQTATTTSTNVSVFPDPSGYTWALIVSGMELPVDIKNASDGSGRLFIVDKRGKIYILENGRVLSDPFLDISSEVDSTNTEQGLVGLAFHPEYVRNGQFFVNYIEKNGNTVIARFSASRTNPDTADPTSEVDYLHVHQPYPNHNGGGLAFGPDGYLYIGLGDGGSGGDPQGNGQNLQTYLGKLLRIDVDHGNQYQIPAFNPFASGGGLPEIWAYGLRNPWRFSFDHLTGDLFIGDVGQDSWEEVDFVPRGTAGGINFGWNYFEATHSYRGQPPATEQFTFPLAEYSHSEGCSITGGYVYRGSVLPEWNGIYLYGDYCSGNIWGIIPGEGSGLEGKLLFSSVAQITSFGVDENGEIYITDYKTGSILKLTKKQ
jgi:glucose/arabinose dehydrogenase